MAFKVMSDEQKETLRQLKRIAGSGVFVQEAILALRRTKGEPTLGDLVEHILANREQWHRNRARPVVRR